MEPPRRFWLRIDDRIVAQGAQWSGGNLSLHWPGRPVYMTSEYKGVDGLLATVRLHGHRGDVEWIDEGSEWGGPGYPDKDPADVPADRAVCSA